MSRGAWKTASCLTASCACLLVAQVTHGFEAYHLGENYSNAIRGYGRLKWRRDGFVSLSAPFDGSTGIVTTKALVLTPSPTAGLEVRILVNIETSVSGQVLVELMSESDPSHHIQSLPIVGNNVAATVIFSANYTGNRNFTCHTENQLDAMPSESDVSLQTDVSGAFRQAGDQGIRLRISVKDARLFSIAFVEVPAGSPAV